MQLFDTVVIGGGVIGVAVARELARRQVRVALFEKESALALHQSGRNSGVAHVGFNQKPGTLKARFVVEGSRRLRDFCRERGVAIEQGGLLVVGEDRAALEGLARRGIANGAKVEVVGADRVRDIEPHARGSWGLWAPEGASFDSAGFVRELAREVPVIFFEEVLDAVEGPRSIILTTLKRRLEAGFVVNAAGLQADRVARRFGVGRGLRIVPFRGEYREVLRPLVRSHVYPAPDPRFPFLGVHLSKRVDGRVAAGPGAVLALGRESYDGGVCFRDLAEMLPCLFRLTTYDFLRLACREWRKTLSTRALCAEARRLIPELRRSDFGARWSGIRAQLVDARGRLVDDLVVERTPRSLHVLNAVSPALTCALPFAEDISNSSIAG